MFIVIVHTPSDLLSLPHPFPLHPNTFTPCLPSLFRMTTTMMTLCHTTTINCCNVNLPEYTSSSRRKLAVPSLLSSAIESPCGAPPNLPLFDSHCQGGIQGKEFTKAGCDSQCQYICVILSILICLLNERESKC